MRTMACAVILCLSTLALSAEDAPKIEWQKWTPDLFERAKKEKRLVLLDLEAVWCHWCHVMDKITYADPDVIALLETKYIAVKVDQDANPDLSNRYEDYGWPATIIFAPDGTEIVKRSAYIPPKPMLRMLQACVDDPTPGPSVQPESVLTFQAAGSYPEDLLKDVRALHTDRYDSVNGGWGSTHKYLDAEAVEYSLLLSLRGDAAAEKMARETLDKSQAHLIDPVWGGLYQYSTGGVWTEPHFEKIMSYQAEGLRAYALAYGTLGDAKYLQGARDIYRFMTTFLRSPDGAFYVSQDADVVQGQHSEDYFKLDDATRRAKGIPRVDTHIYSRENGWAINALCQLYAVSGERDVLESATRAADWIVAQRALTGGGFRHDEKDPGGPYLNDSLSMLRAFVALYSVSGERRWLKLAESTAAFVAENFKLPADGAGFATSVAPVGLPANLRPKPQRDEMVALVRTATRLHHFTSNEQHRALAAQALRYLTAREVAERYPAASPLLAVEDFSAQPVHVTVIGAKNDATARALFLVAQAWKPVLLKRIDWWDRREGAMPNSGEIEYPELPEAAAFACANGRCSSPLPTAEALLAKLDKLLRVQK